MKYLKEFRDPQQAKALVNKIFKVTTRPYTLMEVCGGQTHAIVKFGLDQLLPKLIRLVHGPGCPVCVTPLEVLDQAIFIAQQPQVILCSFGDMLRVPGSDGDLFSAKARGAQVRVVYSPLEALNLAQSHPEQQVVFLAVGFETTAPANAMAVYEAKQRGLKNFSMLVSHVLVPPAMEAILASPQNQVQGFLAAGHVCAVMGVQAYQPICQKYRVPIVVTGFEPLDLLQGILMCVKQLEKSQYQVQNQYRRVVRSEGNLLAQEMIEQVFEVVPKKWRGIGEISQSGFRLRSEFGSFDAANKFTIQNIVTQESTHCISGKILQGLKKPTECDCFGKQCTPEHPLGATMVSSEGACAAYYQYRGALS